MRKAFFFFSAAVITVVNFSFPAAYLSAEKLPQFARTAEPTGYGGFSPGFRLFGQSSPILYVAEFKGSAIGLYPAGVLHPKKIGAIRQGIHFPRDIFVDRFGTLYVANEHPATVSIYPLGQIVPSRVLSLPSSYPYTNAMTAGSDGSIYVSMYNNAYDQWLLEYDPGASSPSRVLSLKNFGGPYCCDMTVGMALDSQSDLWVNHGSAEGDINGYILDEYAPHSIQDIYRIEFYPRHYRPIFPSGSIEIDARDRIYVGDPTDYAVIVAQLPKPGRYQYKRIRTDYAGFHLTLDKTTHYLYAASFAEILIYDYVTGKSLGSTGIKASGAMAVYPTAF